MPKISPLLLVCFWVATVNCAAARTTAEVAAVFDAGVAAYDAGHYDQAYNIWSGIQNEDLAAMRNMAMMLRRGQGMTKNPQKARQIYERAAKAGLVNAQADLADMLLHGETGPPDPKRALPFLEVAAAAHHPVAQYELAQFYETGELVPKNLTIARNLYRAAASHGIEEARVRLAALPPMETRPSVGLSAAAISVPHATVATIPSAPAEGIHEYRSSGYTLQIGAYRTREEADANLSSIREKYAALLPGYSLDVQRADLSKKGIWYRLRILGVSNDESVSALCDRLQADGGCFVRLGRVAAR
jgi:TPR repeat protein